MRNDDSGAQELHGVMLRSPSPKDLPASQTRLPGRCQQPFIHPPRQFLHISKPPSTNYPNHTPLFIAESRPQWMRATLTEGFGLSGEALKEHWRNSMARPGILQYAFCNKYTYAVGHF